MVHQEEVLLEKDDQYQDDIAQKADKFLWLHYENPDRDEVNEVLKHYHLPAHFGEYLFDKFETSWIEYYHNDEGELFTYIILQYPYERETEPDAVYHTAPLVIVMSKDLVITFVTHLNMPFMTEIKNKHVPTGFPITSSYAFVMYMFFEVAQAYIEASSELHASIRKAEEEGRHSTKNTASYALIDVNRSLVYMSTAVGDNRDTLAGINRYFTKNEKNTYYHERVLNRVQIEMHQAETMVKNNLALVEKLNDVLSNVISNNLNDVMSRLTVITIVMTVPTITAGLWGMNVTLPFEDNFHGFSIVLIGTLILSSLVYLMFKKWQ
jgi:magnesium transporter